MASRVFVTGASGFVGGAVVDELLSRGHRVNALVHRGSLPQGAAGAVTVINGDMFDASALDEGMRGCEAVIHLVGIIMEKPGKGVTFERIHAEGTKAVVDATRRNGITRYVHMSALGSRPDAVSRYHKTKFAAEHYVRSSGLDWTIFRPSLIHGPRGEFMQMEAKWARMSAPPFLFMPYFGGRKAGKLQPVYVKDVARAFVDAVAMKNTIGEVYPLGGPNEITWPQLHKTVSSAVVGRERMTAWIPVPIARMVALMPFAPYNADQVIMSQENNTTDIRKFTDDFGWQPQPFEATLRSYAAQL
jgi:NADH dehydrogenase